MSLPSRIVIGAALAVSLGLVPASHGQAVIDMNFNPRPVLNDIETIDLMFPAAFGTSPQLTLFFKVGPPPCTNVSASSCQSLWAQASYGTGSTITYSASVNGTVSFFVRAQAGALVGYTPIGQIITSAANPPLPETPHPVMFVTQVPIPSDYKTVTSSFASHLGRPNASGRGGDLYVRYQDGTLRNLTKLAGFGHSGQQGANSIAVREPMVHWSGAKAIFSMVVGCATSAPSQGNPAPTFFWQLYEVTGLGQLDTPVITRVPNQPANFNNVSPCYGTNGRILFTSDRPRDGSALLYPQLDEYESQETNTGIWSLDPATGDLFLVQHSPSGSFKPFIDSFGRVVFTRWDHLERDQQKSLSLTGDGNYQVFNYPSETSSTSPSPSSAGAYDDEVFPEPHPFFVNHVNQGGYSGDLNGWAPNIGGIQFNRFQPWMVRENGTEEETLNHVGRHELQDVVNRAFNDDAALVAHVLANDPRVANKYGIFHMFQARESGSAPGVYLGVDGRESETHAAGQIIQLSGGLGANPDQMVVTQITHRDTRVPTLTPSANHTGMYRSPIQLSDGQLVSVHTADMGKDANIGTPSNPISRYEFRLKTLRQEVHADGSLRWRDDRPLTAGLRKTVQYRDQFQVVSYSGEMWELDAVEVKARPVPALAPAPLGTPEARAMADARILPRDLREYLRANNLALIVSRNLTTRDCNDKQQPFNLRVAGTTTQTTTGGRLYDIKYLQLFQADQIRAMFWGNPTPLPGRRVLAQPLHDPEALNPPLTGAPAGAVRIANDGSMAALVPARRAMTWQITDGAGNPVVRERYWVTFQPGEIRVCTSCHGANTGDQLDRPAPTNTPAALRDLLEYLKSIGEIAPSRVTQQPRP